MWYTRYTQKFHTFDTHLAGGVTYAVYVCDFTPHYCVNIIFWLVVWVIHIHDYLYGVNIIYPIKSQYPTVFSHILYTHLFTPQ